MQIAGGKNTWKTHTHTHTHTCMPQIHWNQGFPCRIWPSQVSLGHLSDGLTPGLWRDMMMKYVFFVPWIQRFLVGSHSIVFYCGMVEIQKIFHQTKNSKNHVLYILILSDIITYYVSKVAWWFMGFSLCLFLEQDGYWRHVTTPSSLRTTSQIGLGVDLLEIMLIQFQKLD